MRRKKVKKAKVKVKRRKDILLKGSITSDLKALIVHYVKTDEFCKARIVGKALEEILKLGKESVVPINNEWTLDANTANNLGISFTPTANK